jgi:subtilisin
MSHDRAIAVNAFVIALAAITVVPVGRAAAQAPTAKRVIVELALSTGRHVPEGQLRSAASVSAQRRAIADAADRVAASLPSGGRSVLRRYTTVPFIVVEADDATRATLARSPDVIRVMDDTIHRLRLAESVPLIQGDQAWDVGFDGSGTAVAILDTGVDSTHPFLAGKVVDEACFSTTAAGVSQSACPNGTDQQLGPGAAVPCSLADCIHGTHVAGIATGNGASAGVSFSGVAKGAHIVAVQVFSIVTDSATCGGSAPCPGAYDSDIISGLEHAYAVAASFNVASVNMSLGGATFSAPCDDQPEKPAIDNLRAVGVASVIAAGNDYAFDSLAAPACISSAISVGSTDKTNSVSYFSDVAPFLSLFAPGESINSSVPGGGYEVLSGTSMAAPHVAGAFAILHQAVPRADVTTLLTAFQSTGLPITDDRVLFGGGTVIPRISIFKALTSLVTVTSPAPSLTSVSPTHVRAGASPATISLTGSGFNLLSTATWNGTPLATTTTNTHSLQATIPAALLTGASGLVAVANPAPGGGTSAAIAVTVDPPATLTVSSTSVGTSSPVTVTLGNGFGGTYDWLAFAQTGTPYTSYISFIYVGSGVTTKSWTVTTPSTPGTYEFRYFPNNGYSPAAISQPITVSQPPAPVPVVSSLSPSGTVAGAAAFTLTVSGSSFTSASVVRWNGSNRATTFTSATQLQAAITAADVATIGTIPVTVFTPAPGGGTSGALNFTVSAAPVLTVSSTSVPAGSPVSVTVTNGLGGATDWLAFAQTGSPNTSYVTYTYVGAGVTSRTWTITAPATLGTYEFRLFLNNGYLRAATSPTVTVVNPPPPPAPVASSLSPTSTFASSGALTLTVNGANFTTASVVNWNGSPRVTTFVSSTQLRAAIQSADVATVGTAQVSVFTPAPGGGTSSSLAFSIVPGPVLAVSTTSAPAGASVTVTLTGGLGGTWDWIGFAATSAPDTSYIAYTYVGSGVTTRTWTVTMPQQTGTYEFRLFPNNGYVRAATSPTVTVVSAPPPPAPVASSLSPTSTFASSGALTLTVNGANFTTASVVNWNGSPRVTTFVSSTQLSAAIQSADVAAVGTAQVSVFTPAPGGGTSGSLAFSIVPGPVLTVSTTRASPGASVTVTLTGGLGGTWDWIGFAATSAPNTSYIAYTYVGSGVTTRTWTVTMPQQTGTYEFRLFPNNGYVRAATSPTIIVQ